MLAMLGMESLFDLSPPFKPLCPRIRTPVGSVASTKFQTKQTRANISREAFKVKLRSELVRETMLLVSSPSTLLLTNVLAD